MNNRLTEIISKVFNKKPAFKINVPNSYYNMSSTPDTRKTKMGLVLKKITKVFLIIVVSLFVLLLIGGGLAYAFVGRSAMTLANEAKDLKSKVAIIKDGLETQDLDKMGDGLKETKSQLEKFKTVYYEQEKILKRVPRANVYLKDGEKLISIAEESIGLGELVIEIVEPYAQDIGFSTDGGVASSVPAQERIVKLVRLMPEFAPRVTEISDRVQKIDEDLSGIDPYNYPKSLPKFVSKFGIDPDLNIRGEILSAQSVSHELAEKAPQMEALFKSMPKFMGVDAPRRYLVVMANNYELRMSGGFNTYLVVVEMKDGIPSVIYSIDTYFIDEGDRTGSSFLVNRNVPYFLRNYLYLSGNTYRLYARDATSTNADFPLAANSLLNGFWLKDYTLPQNIDGVISINNDVVVDLLRVVGPVKTDSFSVLTDQSYYKSIPVTEFNADNVVQELEDIAGNKLAQTIGRKEIIKFLADKILEKIFTSEATNLLNIADVMLQSLSKKDVMLYSFDPDVSTAFDNLGYSGKIKQTQSEEWDYLHVNRSNFGAGKADWTVEGFVTQSVSKNVEVVNGKKISTVKVTVHNPKRPEWYNIDPCCFYNAYTRVYVPLGSKMVSVEASDGQDVHAAEFVDEEVKKTYIETFTKQQKETDLTITYVYELPNTVNVDNYKLLIQRQSGSSIDSYSVGLEGVSKDILLNADKEVIFD